MLMSWRECGKVIEKSHGLIAELLAAELRWIQFIRADKMNKDGE